MSLNLIRQGTIIDVEQGSQEWLAFRAGKVTASNLYTLIVDGKGVETYINQMVEDSQKINFTQGYQSSAMLQGHEREVLAADRFELEEFKTAYEVGCIQHPTIPRFIASPDRLVPDFEGLEIKGFQDKNYFKHLEHYKKTGEVEFLDPKHYWQCIAGLACSGNDRWHGVIYNENFKIDYLHFVIERDNEVEKQIKEVEERAEEAIYKYDEIIKKYWS